QARTARLQRITRWAVAAVGAVILIGGATVGYLQWDKARQLATKEIALSAEQASNAGLRTSLDRRQVELDHAQANILSELSRTKRLRGEIDSALRLASRGTHIDLALPHDAVNVSSATSALATAVSQANWRFALVGHQGPVLFAAFSPDGSRIVTASDDN